MRLAEAGAGDSVRVIKIGGGMRQVCRFASVGIIPGSVVRVVRNDPHRPLLAFNRDTLLALGKDECGDIQVGEVSA
ncbi:FeoA family protein [Olsenella uli DSM 7084]|uniref:FeoA family protein n=1 Tax=Olsenella uli (strain ATCC 49627 / DSM 7084 / CCUG 31166 / CIP 109912 / JCM 12494 / LMG 11480 / NCIMB 702895 / VPI D76D-27C) TaxID=633147 RepID=E1QYJ2_OLSUV|nr:FeoA family protein [Olsenella uli]ADK67456.1 FeoA family protein [Olsenella uli DSM 7084]KRO11897.1 hypothetical protein IV77_GL001822 [Olsenella uli DSM 7084]MBS6418921.1 ferrous iron transport protein A [Olsenella uli]